ncbi:hypothetical protein F0562_024661 [Nyssa sinensis]|uniref:IST1-like protein n=1 Tax=Nyssa sinensis TaxID=561372 RepID=A0A5J5BDK8_9ASTE|nr:hypothetical protein F0562_024661 [Nyssa sinensis]
MFEGLLKSKFYSKCKSMIKRTKTRLEMIRRKRNAMEKYLKNDIADLLKKGLDVKAFGRAEGLVVELNLSSCYDFVEQFCGSISNHLSMMNKQRDCPEECREAVSSLIFAAARFADLPELRELRSIFTGRYGNSLESYVNQEFVEKLKSMPPTKDMKLQLMQDIALEAGTEWDSKALEQKLYKPPASEQDLSKDGNHNRYKSHKGVKDYTASGRNKEDLSSHGRKEVNNDGYTLRNCRENAVPKGDNQGCLSHERPINKEDLSSHGRKEVNNDGNKLHNCRENAVPKDSQGHLSHERLTPSKDIQVESVDPNGRQHNSNSVNNVSKEEVDAKMPSHHRLTPPPYIKPNISKKGANLEHKSNSVKDVSPEEVDDNMPSHHRLTPPPYIKPKVSKNRTSLEVPRADSGGEGMGHAKLNGCVDGKDDHVQDNLVGEAKPKPRSVRRRCQKPQPNYDQTGSVEGDGKEKMNSNEIKWVLKILNEDAHGQKDEEEKVMDGLLMHYSTKQSPHEQCKVEATLKPPPAHQTAVDSSKATRQKSKDGHPARATSFPLEPTSPIEATKGPARASSFEPNMLNLAGHVHPKLPDYDDFVARFAALRGN